MTLTTLLQDYLIQEKPNLDPTLKSCEKDIYFKGIPIAIISGNKTQIEVLVQAMVTLLGLKIDWHFSGGQAQVLLHGDKTAHYIATTWLSSNIKVMLEFKYLEPVDKRLDYLIQDKFCYQKDIVQISSHTEDKVIKLVIDPVHAEQIERVIVNHTKINPSYVFKKQYTPPLDIIDCIRIVPYGGAGLYRSEEYGDVDNSNIDESRVVRA